MEQQAVIDIGTNSIRLLVGEKSNQGKIIPIYADNKITRLGDGVDQSGYLNSQAVMRTLAGIQEYRTQIISMNIEYTNIIATSAVRDAKNKEEFAEKVADIMGIPLEILSGEEEAQLSYQGVIKGLKKNLENILVIDIGGGSTEITWGIAERIINAQSLQMGAVRLTERFIERDWISSESYQAMIKYIEKQLQEQLEIKQLISEIQVIGVGGTVTTCAAIDQNMEVYNWKKIHGYVLNRENIQRIQNMLLSKSLKERQKVKGLQPQRADIIISGIAILLQVMEYFNCKNITISETDLLYGRLVN